MELNERIYQSVSEVIETLEQLKEEAVIKGNTSEELKMQEQIEEIESVNRKIIALFK